MKKYMRLLTVLLALAGLGFSANYAYASTACNTGGELFSCNIFPGGMSAAAKDAACDCACAVEFGFFGQCDSTTDCCLCVE